MSDFEAKKSLGQHWLNDPTALQAMCDAAEVAESDHILEIGPGKGSLTNALLQRGASIFAIEFDPQAIPYLRSMFARQWDVQVHVEQGDIRSFNLTRMEPGYKIAANIPYYLTSHLIQILSESVNPPQIAVLLVQREVAQRVCAGPGRMSLLSVSAQFYWEASLGMEVPARLFTPVPKVNSQILILKHRERPLFDVDTKKFFRLVKAGYASKRKTLTNSLSGGLRADKGDVLELLESAQLSPAMRPQELSLEQWQVLYNQALAQGMI